LIERSFAALLTFNVANSAKRFTEMNADAKPTQRLDLRAAGERLAAFIGTLIELIEEQAQTNRQLRLLIGSISRPQAGLSADADRRRKGEESSENLNEIRFDAELPDRPTVNEVASWLKKSPNAIYTWAQKGLIQAG
jgi:hypothetical protein